MNHSLPKRGQDEWPNASAARSIFPRNGVVVDVETTTDDPATGSIIQVGARKWETGELYAGPLMRPWPGSVVQDAALSVNGQTRETLDAAECSWVAGMADFFQWLGLPSMEGPGARRGKWVLYGWRAWFDYAFLRQAWNILDGEPRQFPFHRSGIVDLRSQFIALLQRECADMPPHSPSSSDAWKLLGMAPEPAPHEAWRGAVWCAEGFARVNAFLGRSPSDTILEDRETEVDGHLSAFRDRLDTGGWSALICPF